LTHDRADERRRPAALTAQLALGLALTAALAVTLPACKTVCQKFADHLEECRVDYCRTHAENPICGDRYAARDNRVAECPDALEPIVQSQLEKDCATLAREMGWEALDRLPVRQSRPTAP
jgi:hypothetical protein